MTLAALRERFGGAGRNPADELELAKSCGDTLPYRSLIVIEECGEPLSELPRSEFARFEPHPYLAAGAQYEGASPFWVREGVLFRLMAAQELLRQRKPNWGLKIFDAYRPNQVQEYMVRYTRNQVAAERGIDPDSASDEQLASIMSEVYKVWAMPSEDLALPTPHSTGSAVDLTLIDSRGEVVDMGGEIDAICSETLPNFYRSSTDDYGVRMHANRSLLNEILSEAGFCRLPHEWWHFSYGDQMWGLLKSLQGSRDVAAIYGRVADW